jgi:uncharacterized protein (TIGR03435 family)
MLTSMSISVLGIVLLTIPASTNAQSKPSLAFAASSIKPNDSVNSDSSTSFLPGGRFVAKFQTLSRLIINAYRLKDYQLSGGPAWTSSERYDIEAAAENDPNRDDMRVMLQNLLAERFQLRVRREEKDLPVYALSVGRNGTKLSQSPPRETTGFDVGTGKLTAYGVTMAELADELSRRLDRPVIDKTGIRGRFDFSLQYALIDSQAKPVTVDVSLPDILTAIQEQLGLKLESTKAPIEVLVIESAQKPKPN